jgi:hypothetical protein
VTRVVVVPGVLALSAAYASVADPVADLRTAVTGALAWLGPEVEVVGSAQGRRLAEELLARRDAADAGDGGSVLIVLNGSACRTEKAPGYLDPRAEEFDRTLGEALRASADDALADIDRGLGEELWADLEALPRLATLIAGAGPPVVDYDAAPYGVQYWVLRWEC